jgi:hypothetical protein
MIKKSLQQKWVIIKKTIAAIEQELELRQKKNLEKLKKRKARRMAKKWSS